MEKYMCWSNQRTLAPGDSVVGEDVMQVTSPPGTYQLRVRHLLDPERWVTLRVVVRPSS
jgi:hypothetical protein